MDERRQDGNSAEVGHEVVRAHRFELIDVNGRVRAVLGVAPGGGGEGGVIADVHPGHHAYGLTVLDRQGSGRVSLTTDGTSASLTLFIGGNAAVAMGVADPETAENVAPGGYLALYRSEDGSPVTRWLATPAGELVVEMPMDDRGDDA